MLFRDVEDLLAERGIVVSLDGPVMVVIANIAKPCWGRGDAAARLGGRAHCPLSLLKISTGLRGHCHVNRKFCRPNGSRSRNGSRCKRRLTPCLHSLIAKHTQRSAADQMALDVKHIVDGGVG
jgi:hypothetical protein